MRAARNQILVVALNDRTPNALVRWRRRTEGDPSYGPGNLPRDPGFFVVVDAGPGIASEHRPELEFGDVVLLDQQMVNIETNVDGHRAFFAPMGAVLARWPNADGPPEPLNNEILTVPAPAHQLRHMGLDRTMLELPRSATDARSSDAGGYLKHLYERVLAVGEGRTVRGVFNAIPQDIVGDVAIFSSLRVIDVEWRNERGDLFGAHLVPFFDVYGCEDTSDLDSRTHCAPATAAA